MEQNKAGSELGT
ncbi:Protein of unknown function [Pyronema omphalodes CBS 100304]|uniref:Uncharacterized protein n=1 Tax=Pyronema omphalodes (strain CBS 100304) TaxID=1076935 RepID=U4LGC7_PYROM|nr:Protein of unknown function [Pyronema omphalodes CBS 100304]